MSEQPNTNCICFVDSRYCHHKKGGDCRSKASRIILMMPRNYKNHSRMKKAIFQAKAKVSRKELR